MHFALALVTLFAVAKADEIVSSRSAEPTTISAYPFIASLLRNPGTGVFAHQCSGTIINNRSVLTAARCVNGDLPARWRLRLGSANVASGGTLFNANLLIVHDYDEWSMMNDVAIIRSASSFTFGTNVREARFPGVNYVVHDYQPIVAVGWGYLGMPGWTPSQYASLRRFQTWAINTNSCRSYYSTQGMFIQYSMLCSGFPYAGPNAARDKCFGEPGGPLIHGDNVVVGIRSWALSCNNAYAPAINTRVSTYTNWILNNA